MRYVAFFLILVITSYFLFVKPFLSSKGIDFGLKGIHVDTEEVSAGVGEIFLYIPLTGKSKLFLRLENLHLRMKDLPEIHLGKGALNLHLEGRSKEVKSEGGSGSPPSLVIPPQIRFVSLRVDEFIFTLSGVNDLSVRVSDLVLNRGDLGFKGRVYLPDSEIDFYADGILFKENSIDVGSISVSSDLFFLRVEGSVEGQEPSAEFKLSGGLNRIDAGQVIVEPVKVVGSGRASYEGIYLDLDGEISAIRLVGRKDFEGVKFTARLSLSPGGASSVEGEVFNDVISASYRYLINQNVLEAKVSSLPVDSELAGVDVFLSAWVNGDMRVDLNNGSLDLYATTNGLTVENFTFQKGELALDFNYKKGDGHVEALLEVPGALRLSGKIDGKDFRSFVQGDGLLVGTMGAYLYVSLMGSVNYLGKPQVDLTGVLEDIYYGDIYVGSVPFSLELDDSKLDLSYEGTGFLGSVKGDLKKDIVFRHEFHGFERSLKGIELKIGEGVIESFWGNSVKVAAVGFTGLELRKGDVRLRLSGEGSVDINDLTGGFHLRVREARSGHRDLGDGFAEVNVQKGMVKGSYGFDGIVSLEGDLSGDLRKLGFSTSGFLSSDIFKVEFGFAGTPHEGKLNLKGSVYLSEEDPMEIAMEGSYHGKEIDLRIEPTEFSVRALGGRFEGARVSGIVDEEITLELRPIHLFLINKEIFETEPTQGIYKNGEFTMTLKSGGAVVGKTHLKTGDVVSLTSEGYIDLDRLSFFISSPLNGRAEGKLRYKLSLKGDDLEIKLITDDDVVVYSRYMSLPMSFWVEGRLVRDTISAFLALERGGKGISVNLGSQGFKDAYLYILAKELPLSYRAGGITADLKLSSEGWVNVRDGKKVDVRLNSIFSGEVVVSKLGGGGGESESAGTESSGDSGVSVELDVGFQTDKPVRVTLPEGYVYVNIKGWVGGNARDPDYSLVVEFLSGELTYFSRKFFVRGGRVVLLKEEGVEDRLINLSLVNPSPDLSIYIDLKGELEDPDIVVWSEPPRSAQELLTKLIIGSSAEGILPVAQTIFKRFGYMGDIKSGLASLLGVEISLSTETGSQGDIGFNLNVKKKIARAFAVEYQQSTLRDPRATYYGGSLFLPGGASFYGRVFADNTSEVKIRFIRKFDF